MKKRSVLAILLINLVLLVLIINTIKAPTASQIVPITDDILEPNYAPVTYNNFSDCFSYVNDSLIDSTNYNDSVSFEYNGGTTEKIREYYVLNWDSLGNCSDFNIKLKFTYDTVDHSSMMSFYLYAGSYYDYLGNYIGKDYTNNTHYLGYAAVYDAWIGTRGKYAWGAYVNDVQSPYVTSDILPYDGNLTLQLTRNTTGFYSAIHNSISGALLYGSYWSSGVDKPLNYLMFEFRIGNTQTYSQATAYELDAKLFFEDISDTIDPYVNITNPVNGTELPGNSTTILWEGFDLESGLDSYFTKLDANGYQDVGLATSQAYYNLSEGLHEVEVLAFDKESNNFSDFVSFYMNYSLIIPDTTKPYVQIISPTNSTITANDNITVTWTGYDLDSGLKEYQIRLDSIEWIIIDLNTTYDFYLLVEGYHVIEVKAIDNFNNEFISHVIIEIDFPEPDTIAPEVTIISPINGSRVSQDNLIIYWSGSDASGIANYYIKIDNGVWSDVGLATSLPVLFTNYGEHTVEVKAVDNYLNEKISLVTFTVVDPTTIVTPGYTYLITVSSMVIFFLLNKTRSRLRKEN